MDQIIDQPHVVIGIVAGELYPIADEDLVIGEPDAIEESHGEEQGNQYTDEPP